MALRVRLNPPPRVQESSPSYVDALAYLEAWTSRHFFSVEKIGKFGSVGPGIFLEFPKNGEAAN